jgi:hypothetical protein
MDMCGQEGEILSHFPLSSLTKNRSLSLSIFPRLAETGKRLMM